MKATIILLRKIVIFIAGMLVLIAGVVMLVAPGPGLLGIIAGLLILSTEFDWAKRHLHNARSKMKQVNEKIREKAKKDKTSR